MHDFSTQSGDWQPEVDTAFDVVVVGAGFAGMYMLHCLRKFGLARGLTRPVAASAAPGTGIVILVLAATLRACSTLTPFHRS